MKRFMVWAFCFQVLCAGSKALKITKDVAKTYTAKQLGLMIAAKKVYITDISFVLEYRALSSQQVSPCEKALEQRCQELIEMVHLQNAFIAKLTELKDNHDSNERT